MKLSRYLLPAIALFGLTTATSCSDDDNNQNIATLNLNYTDNTTLSTNPTDKSVEALTGASYAIEIDYNTNTCKMDVNDLQYDSQKTAVSFSVPATRIAVSSSGYVVRFADPVELKTTMGASVTLSNFNMEFTMRMDGSSALTMLAYTINGYDIEVMLNNSYFVGTTSSTIIGDEENAPFSTTNSQYMVIVDRKNNTAQIRIANPQFSADMPTNLGVMVFDNVPVTFTSHGFAAAVYKVIPEIATTSSSVPYPQFAITNLKVAYVAGMHLNMEFDCAAFNRHVEVATRPY